MFCCRIIFLIFVIAELTACTKQLEEWVNKDPSKLTPTIQEDLQTNISTNFQPPPYSNTTALAFSVDGLNLNGYKYKLGLANSNDCADEAGYSSLRSLAQNISEDLSVFPDSNLKICIIGIDTKGAVLPSDKRIEKTWNKDTAPPLLSAFKNLSEVYSSQLTSFIISGTCSENGQDVLISGSISAAVACTAGSYSLPVDLNSVPDGQLQFQIDSRDLAGNQTSNTVSNVFKDTGAPAEITFNTFSATISESTQSQAAQVSLDISKPYDIKIDFKVSGDAISGTHYSEMPSSVTIPAGQTSATISFNSLSNAMSETDRRLVISLFDSSKINTRISMKSNFTVDFIDDDSAANRSPIVDFSLDGSNASCVLHQNGILRCWGNNYWGQVGDGTGSPRVSPIRIGGATTYKRVVESGGPSTCALTNSNTIQCWGWGAGGQLGYGGTGQQNSPVNVTGGNTYKMVAGGGAHACGITSADKLQCWGYNPNGNVGDGSTSNRASPTNIDSANNYIYVDVADIMQTCGILASNKLKCWGANTYGNLGDGTTTQRTSPVAIDSSTDYVRVSGGAGHTCGITTAGQIKCWGQNNKGQLGDGTTTSSLAPMLIDSSTTYKEVYAAGYSTCAITSSDFIKCWGEISGGDGKSDSTTNILIPKFFDPGVTYSKVKVTTGMVCGITIAGEFKCFSQSSANSGFPFGTSYLSTSSPRSLHTDKAWKRVDVDANSQCALDNADKLFCWGSFSGSLVSNNSFVPTPVLKNEQILDFSVGSNTKCLITSQNKLYCWGNNIDIFTGTSGLVGSGTASSTVSSPTPIDSSSLFSKVSTGGSHTCAITTTGTLKCWGDNTYGSYGDGTAVSSSVPVVVQSDLNFTDVSVGFRYTCAIDTNQKLWCWGRNQTGQLGDGTTTSTTSRVQIDSGNLFKRVFASNDWGNESTCAITTADVLRCWGDNAGRQLGDGTTTDRISPVTIDSGITYSSITEGVMGFSRCGIRVNGKLRCWGQNTSGNLGDGTTTTRATPVDIDASNSYLSITTNYNSTCGVTTTGVLKCWGAKGANTTGEGTSAPYPIRIPKLEYF